MEDCSNSDEHSSSLDLYPKLFAGVMKHASLLYHILFLENIEVERYKLR